ncbi:MAG: carbohydrate ABC transporter permease [Planctomycetes bacterium]|nr:carbohydrate ABC transporter permease [Planctomycetota bacterium]
MREIEIEIEIKSMRYARATLLWLFLTAAAAVMALPLAWMVVSAFKTKREIYTSPLALPEEWRWENFAEAWRTGQIGLYAWNSLLVTAASVTGILALAALAAYALARMEFRGKSLVAALFVAGLVLPIQSYLLALDRMLAEVGLKNAAAGFTVPLLGRRVVVAHLALIVPYVATELPIAVFILYAFFRTLPRELEDAARLDGCTPFGVFARVMLPLVRPALATVAIIATLATWNEFLLAQTFLVSAGTYQDVLTLPVGLNAFSGAHATQEHLVLAALTIVTLPTLLAYFLFQRQIVGGLTAGALKG